MTGMVVKRRDLIEYSVETRHHLEAPLRTVMGEMHMQSPTVERYFHLKMYQDPTHPMVEPGVFYLEMDGLRHTLYALRVTEGAPEAGGFSVVRIIEVEGLVRDIEEIAAIPKTHPDKGPLATKKRALDV